MKDTVANQSCRLTQHQPLRKWRFSRPSGAQARIVVYGAIMANTVLNSSEPGAQIMAICVEPPMTGKPFNIASYAVPPHPAAQDHDLRAGDFVHSFGDVHLDLNHVEQAKQQLSRAPRPLPTLCLNPDGRDIFAFRYDDVRLDGCDPHPLIRAPVAV